MYLRFILFFAPSAGHVFMHGLVVSFYFYHSGSCVEYAATLFAAELVNVVWFFHHCLPGFVADVVPYFGFIFGCFVYFVCLVFS